MDKQKWVIINPEGETREILLSDNQEIVARTILKKGQIGHLEDKSRMDRVVATQEGFINVIYVSNELLFNKYNLSLGDMTRFLYICTYVEWNNKEENLLIQKRVGQENIPMNRRDIKEKLGLSDRAFKTFFKTMRDNNLMFEVKEDGETKIYITNEIVTKGQMGENKENYTRLFIKPIRMLYENCPPRKHKQLGYIYQLIPFLDYDTNGLKIDDKPMEIKEMMQMLGLSTSSKNAISKFENSLLDFTIKYEDKEYYVFGSVTFRYGKEKRTYFAINPLCLYQGRDMDMFKAVSNQLLIK